MLSRLRESLLQNNRVLPVVLAALAVLALAWVIFGLVLGGKDQGGQVADQDIVAQAQDEGADSPAPEVENRNVDSYAAYEAKDPFRQIVEPADSGAGGGTGGGTDGSSTVDGGGSGTDSDNGSDSGSNDTSDDTGDTVNGGTRGGDTSIAGGGRRDQGLDSDNDGLNDRRENRLGQDPSNPDTDGDGIQDGADDSNGDGRPDGRVGGRGGGNGGSNGGSTGGNDDLFDSGGSLLPGGK